MADTRTPRVLGTREKTAREEYRPPSTLPDPEPDASWTYHWVATHVLGTADPTNTSKRFRDGWVPVKAEDHPELGLVGDTHGNVEIGGLMLCKMPRERADARQRYYQGQAAAQMESVDSTFMKSNDPRMPLFSNKESQVERGGRFGSGS